MSGDVPEALLRRWYITIPGLLLSVVVAALGFALVPPHYTSSGTAVLVQPKLPGTNPQNQNPLLTSGVGLNTTASILVQALNAPVQALNAPSAGSELGLIGAQDSFTVRNTGGTVGAAGDDQPFIIVSAQSADPQRSMDIVVSVMGKAQAELSSRQNALHIFPRNAIRMETVVDATPAKTVRTAPLAASGAALMFGALATILVACAWNRRVLRVRAADTRHGAGIENGFDQSVRSRPADLAALPPLGDHPLARQSGPGH
jgi:hypothetical protein